MQLTFDNRLRRELPGDVSTDPRPRQVTGAVWSEVMPTPVAAPRVLAVSHEVLASLGWGDAEAGDPLFAAVFGGNALLPGMQPFATNYGGHQFGHWAGQLGDGRAISLGEVITPSGARAELQLKGAGRTPYSRGADGRAVLRSSIREFLCSEAMAHLGVPTTRALCLVGTGDAVVRDMFYDGHPRPEPGAIVCRVAPSFLRFGHFELPASRGDVDLLRRLVDFTIARDFPWIEGAEETRYAAWFAEIARRTARLIAEWMRVGFVHGVMNTDNLSILGLTIDYGPYGWVDDFDPDWTPNTTDAQNRRYRFGAQPQIAYWNLGRLAQALAPLFPDTTPLQDGRQAYVDAFVDADRAMIAAKLGLREASDADIERMRTLHGLLHAGEVDMTLFFRILSDHAIAAPTPASFADAYYDTKKAEAIATALQAWLDDLGERIRFDALPPEERRAVMHRANPRYVLRNYLAQQVIDRAEQGDTAGITELLDVLRHPYDDQPGRERFAARRPDWARNRAGCSMLSCSS